MEEFDGEMLYNTENIALRSFKSLQGYIFCILKHFPTKLCNSINFKITIPTVVKDFVISV